MPQAKHNRVLPAFDTRSVMLFAALTMGGALAQAQTSSAPAAQPRFQAGPASGSRPSFGPAGNTATDSAFARADTNQDGQLSPQEAARLPAVGNRFQALDTDKNGSLSRAEFDAGTAK